MAPRPVSPLLLEWRVWLDDDFVDRAAPDGWLHLAAVADVIRLLDTGNVVELSLDHDLGDARRFGRGIDVILWLIDQQEVHDRLLWPRDGILLHTANPEGRDTMARAIERHAGKRLTVRRTLTRGGHPRFRFVRRR
ncbi:MAG: cyclic-phosphate processing receiver domain-containing protein [Solirubrobacteraceae bacterium]